MRQLYLDGDGALTCALACRFQIGLDPSQPNLALVQSFYRWGEGGLASGLWCSKKGPAGKSWNSAVERGSMREAGANCISAGALSGCSRARGAKEATSCLAASLSAPWLILVKQKNPPPEPYTPKPEQERML